MNMLGVSIFFTLCLLGCLGDEAKQKFEVKVKTGDRDGAETNGDVWLWILGQFTVPGKTDEFWWLDNTVRNDFENGQLDTFEVESKTLIGDVLGIEIGNAVNAMTFFGDKWYLESVVITETYRSDGKPLAQHVYTCNCWIDSGYHVLLKENQAPRNEQTDEARLQQLAKKK